MYAIRSYYVFEQAALAETLDVDAQPARARETLQAALARRGYRIVAGGAPDPYVAQLSLFRSETGGYSTTVTVYLFIGTSSVV